MKNKKCPQCGQNVNQDSKFCPNCGYQFPATRAAAPDKQPKKRWWPALVMVLVIVIVAVGGTVLYRMMNESSPSSAPAESSATSNSAQTSSTTGRAASSEQPNKSSSATLDAASLTAKQNAALALYYGVEHMPGASDNDYSGNMGMNGQTATVDLYRRDNVPDHTGPIYKESWPSGAQVLYVVKLQKSTNSDSTKINQIYYTIDADNKVYFDNGDGDFTPRGVTKSAMVEYAKMHDGVARVNNVAKNIRIVNHQ